MIKFNEKMKLLKVEERTYQDNKYLKIRFLCVDEIVDLTYYLNDKNNKEFVALANLPLNTECLVELGFNPETKSLRLLDCVVVK